MTSAVVFDDGSSKWGGYLADYLQTRDGIHKTGELIIHALDWTMPHFEGASLAFAKQASHDLKGITSSLSVPEFVENVFQFANRLSQVNTQAEIHPTDYKDIIYDGGCVFNSGCDAALFLESKNFIDLRGSVPVVERLFWGSALALSGIDVYDQVNAAFEYHQKAQEPLSSRVSYYHRMINVSYMRIVKAVISVAMASLALVSFVYGNLAEGVMLLPTLFLGLSTVFVLLSIMTYFCERFAEEDLKALKC